MIRQRTLVFRGGPRDGESEPVQEGWPAPPVYRHRDVPGEYRRQGVHFNHRAGEVRHLYAYQPPPENGGEG